MTTVHPPPSGRHALRGAVICGLVLTAGATGPVPALLRAVTPLLAGRGLARARSLRAIGWLSVHTLLIWALSFSPLVLLASPEVLRTYAIAVGLALALRGLSVPATLAFGGGALAAAAAVADLPPHFGLLGGLEYALGASWPRGWSDVARVVGLRRDLLDALMVAGQVPVVAKPARITASRKVSQPVLALPSVLSVSDCLKA